MQAINLGAVRVGAILLGLSLGWGLRDLGAQRGGEQSKQPRPSDLMNSQLQAQDIVLTIHVSADLATAIRERQTRCGHGLGQSRWFNGPSSAHADTGRSNPVEVDAELFPGRPEDLPTCQRKDGPGCGTEGPESSVLTQRRRWLTYKKK